MRAVLIETNRDLAHQAAILLKVIEEAKVPSRLLPFVERVKEICNGVIDRAARSLKDLEYDVPSIIGDVADTTRGAVGFFELVAERLAPPIIRAKQSDKVVLELLYWMHQQHPQTKALPFAFDDGKFAVYPTTNFPPVYRLPVSAQFCLLYLSLFYHEFGHVLFTVHEPELRDLIGEFQQVVTAHLAPATVRDRPSRSRDEKFRTDVILKWYPWLLELFCDAVGLTIGGPAYLRAFSQFFRLKDNKQYYMSREDLVDVRVTHPVTWLRILLLCDRARRSGLSDVANRVERDWQKIAELREITQDFGGVWADEYLVPFQKTVDNMLIEAGPPRWADLRRTGKPDDLTALLDTAWEVFDSDPSGYPRWENAAISGLGT
jgi:hypothetical protein